MALTTLAILAPLGTYRFTAPPVCDGDGGSPVLVSVTTFPGFPSFPPEVGVAPGTDAVAVMAAV